MASELILKTSGGTNVTVLEIDGSGNITNANWDAVVDGAGVSHTGELADLSDTQSDEEVQDLVNALLAGGSNITLTYDDANDTLTIDTSALNEEEVEDAVSTLLTGGTGISLTYDDANDTLTIDGHTRYSDEEAQDAVGGILGSLFTYDDANNTITFDEGEVSHDAIDQTTVSEQDHHGEPLAYSPGMVEVTDGLASEEFHRIQLQSGETLEVERIEFQQKGGGSSTSASVDVYDATAASVIGSADLGSVTKDPGTSGSGNTILVRVSNSTGGTVNASPRVVGYIEGA